MTFVSVAKARPNEVLPDVDYDGMPNASDPHPYVADAPAVTWDVTDITFTYDLSEKTHGEERSSHQNIINFTTEEEHSTQEQNTNNRQTDRNAEASIDVRASLKLPLSFNPFRLFSSRLDISADGRSGAGIAYAGRKAYEYRRMSGAKSSEQMINSQQELTKVIRERQIKNPHWKITMQFFNNTERNVLLDDCHIPIMWNHSQIALAEVDPPQKTVTLPAGRSRGVTVAFRAPMLTTEAGVVANIDAPSFEFLQTRGRILYQANNSSPERDIITVYHRIYNKTARLTIRCSGREVTFFVARWDRYECTNATLRSILQQINNMLEERPDEPPFCNIRGGEIVAMMGQPNYDLRWWHVIDRGMTVNHTDYLDTPVYSDIVLEYQTNLPRLNTERIALYGTNEPGFCYALMDIYISQGMYAKAWELCRSVSDANFEKTFWPIIAAPVALSNDAELCTVMREAAQSKCTNTARAALYCLVQAGMCERVKGNITLIELGDKRGMFDFGVMYENGVGVPQNYTNAVEWYRKAAELGYAPGMANLGVMYYYGQGVPQSNAKAHKWYRKAAHLGNACGMHNLGVLYENGVGVPQNYTKAVEWYRKAAELGYARGMVCLGELYEYGKGVPQDYTNAVEWYRKATKIGAYGMANLGVKYYYGKGVPQNYEKAREWFLKAAEQGDVHGMDNLGMMYENGKGVPQNYTNAVEWYQKAAELGDAVGMYRLGMMYENGKGVPQNCTNAVEWYQRAAVRGQNDAKDALRKQGLAW